MAFLAGSFEEMRKQRQAESNGVLSTTLRPSSVTILRQVTSFDIGEIAGSERASLPALDSNQLLGRTFFPWCDFLRITVEAVRQGGALCLRTRDKDTSVHFAFDEASPSLSFGFGVERFGLDWMSLPSDFRLPLVLAAFCECRQGCT